MEGDSGKGQKNSFYIASIQLKYALKSSLPTVGLNKKSLQWLLSLGKFWASGMRKVFDVSDAVKLTNNSQCWARCWLV
jgi:hypothetical protein